MAARASPPASLQTGPTSVSLGLPQQGEEAVDQRADAAGQPAGGTADDGPGLAGVPQLEELAGDGGEGLVPGDWLELRVGVALAAAHPLERRPQPVAVVEELGHHRPFDAQPAGLHGVVVPAFDVDDPPGLEVDPQPAERVAELAG